ncbi:methylated-DNA--[protein]-cysteine S-methyltransferase [Tomitella fengzijianii]|uniref:methylated-DNA--[protein]-cysteine S-methyltransferase n=1 Tax=Tomitella fengzijianii TaxID=2597660 RepID=UPI001E2A9819|nr:methylated-DNA--[protein]-cysteine S-methyltransferase [Tomitella fengzijianii]
MRTHTVIDSPIGPLTLIGDDGALCGLYMRTRRHPPAADALGERVDHGFAEATTQIREYFARERDRFTLPLAPRGTAFQLAVWELLRAIPYGRTCSYAELAGQLGRPSAVRAVAAANGRNPLSIVVPCHRVIGSDGRLVGYGGGLERKEFLLRLEAGGGQDALF